MHLRIKNIEFSYESTRILDDITFEVKSGEFLGIMGPNGSGKTTLLRCISNVLSPQVGTVLIDDESIQKFSKKEVAKKIGVVPQTSNVDFAFTVSELVLMGRTPHTERFKTETRKDFRIAEKAMKLTNTLHLADRTFDEVSGGEKQRIIIARALAQEPEILLLDEPTVYLDINSQIEILNLVRDLCEQKKIVVISVFHDLNLAAQYSDKLILLDKGLVTSKGSPTEVLTPENIKETYDLDVIIKRHPITNTPYVTPFFTEHVGKKEGHTVHVICGGGSGSDMMRHLLDKGFKVTAGVLNILDSDFETAKSLEIPVIGEIPFSQISDESHNANIESIKSSDFVIVSNFPIGPGNMKNIEAARIALDNEVRVIVIDSSPISQRDFIHGDLAKYMDRLKADGAIFVRNPKEALKIILKEASA